jgi:hypothetical protein
MKARIMYECNTHTQHIDKGSETEYKIDIIAQ